MQIKVPSYPVMGDSSYPNKLANYFSGFGVDLFEYAAGQFAVAFPKGRNFRFLYDSDPGSPESRLFHIAKPLVYLKRERPAAKPIQLATADLIAELFHRDMLGMDGRYSLARMCRLDHKMITTAEKCLKDEGLEALYRDFFARPNELGIIRGIHKAVHERMKASAP
jgi:hypothetical protein